MRLINNRWGSDELRCSGTTQSVSIGADKSLNWAFNRPTCGGANAKPDFPEIEFGVAPFGSGSSLLTTPPFSSTSLLPIQVSALTSASVKVEGMTINLQKGGSWNITFEMWLTQQNPLTSSNPGTIHEIMTFWGWQAGRWPCVESRTMTAGTNTYQLCHQSNAWGPNSNWRYFQFNVNGGPLNSYSGTVDVKAVIDWHVTNYSLSRSLWLTRMEVGSEIDDQTQGSVKVRNITFMVNGTSKTPEFAP